MAFLLKPEQDETLNPSNSGGIIGSDTAATAPGSAPSTGEPTSSGFVDLRKYLDQNTEQAAGVGKTVAKTLDEKGAGVAQESTTARTALETDISTKNKRNDELIDRAATDPLAVSKDQPSADDFYRMYSGTYLGPDAARESDYYSPLQVKAEDATRTSKLADSEAGRFELLSGLGGPQRTRGESTLDQALLQTSPVAMNDLTAASAALGNLANSSLSGFETAGDELISKTRGDVSKTKDDIYGRFFGDQGVIPGMESDLSARYSAMKADAAKKLKAAYDPYAKEWDVYESLYEQMMADPANQLGHMPGTDPMQAPIPDPAIPSFDPGVKHFASADEYAREAALEAILRQELGVLPTSQSSAAGTWEQMLADLLAANGSGRLNAPPTVPTLPLPGTPVDSDAIPTIDPWNIPAR